MLGFIGVIVFRCRLPTMSHEILRDFCLVEDFLIHNSSLRNPVWQSIKPEIQRRGFTGRGEAEELRIWSLCFLYFRAIFIGLALLYVKLITSSPHLKFQMTFPRSPHSINQSSQ
jgi:hypothetical protein